MARIQKQGSEGLWLARRCLRKARIQSRRSRGQLGSLSRNRPYRRKRRTKARRHRGPDYGTWHAYGTQEGPDEDRLWADDAVSTIKGLSEQNDPWCYYVGFIGPHHPYFVDQEFLDLYSDEDIKLPSSYDDDLVDKPNIYERLCDQVWDQLFESETRDSLRHYLAYCSKMDHYFGEVLDAL